VSKPISPRNGMAALGRTPVFPKATGVGALSAQLRRSRPRSEGVLYVDSRPRPNVSNAQIAVMSGRRPLVKGRFEPVVSARGAVMSSACRCGRTTPDEWFSSGQFAQRMLSRPSSRSAPASAAEPRLLDHGPAASRRKARYQLQGSAPTVRRRSPGSMRRRAKR
jgi:hypothetical protein